MRNCNERGGTTTTSTTTTSSSSSFKVVDHYTNKQRNRINHKYLTEMLHPEFNNYLDDEKIGRSERYSMRSSDSFIMSSLHNRTSQSEHFASTQWSKVPSLNEGLRRNGLIGSILREDGHIYSLAVDGDLIYTGSDAKHIRVWKGFKEFSGFKSASGLVKAIVLSGEKIFTGHQDGKIRVWRASVKDPTVYKRLGALPNFKEFVKKSFNPKNYVEVRRHCNGLRIRHYDAVSCMSLNEEEGLLYSGSWDRTMKVWRVSDSKCVDSVNAHDDAVNAVVACFNGLVFTGSADGTVKVWRRQFDTVNGKSTVTHTLHQTLLKQENAVTALAANAAVGWLYCGASDGLVNFWECGKQVSHGGVLRGHKLAVLCLAAAGNLVFSGGADKSICVWRRGEGGVHTCLSVLSGHTGPVKCLTVHEDDDHESAKQDKVWVVYSGSLDKSVKVWRVSEKSPELRKMQLI